MVKKADAWGRLPKWLAVLQGLQPRNLLAQSHAQIQHHEEVVCCALDHFAVLQQSPIHDLEQFQTLKLRTLSMNWLHGGHDMPWAKCWQIWNCSACSVLSCCVHKRQLQKTDQR
jgi:hypothetical protein